MNAPAASLCPRCQQPVTDTVDPATGTLTCGSCGTRFDPRQKATATGGPPPAEPTLDDLATGQQIAGYTLLRHLGSGGMATVWAADRPDGGPPVALKLLHAGLDQDAALVRRFRREIEALSQVDHAHIVRVIDHGDWRGRPYLVTDLVGDHSMRDEFLQAPEGLTPARVRDLAGDVLAGLARAHQQGLVHRDIKPENLIVDGDGHIRISDFGIAQVQHGPGGDTLTQLTNTDVVMGTVAYMAPEQSTASAQVDHRVDLYALGVVCYEGLTGQRPMGRFEDPGEHLSDCAPAVQQAWNNFILTLLERDPDRRPANATAARELLDTIDRAANAPEAVDPLANDEALDGAMPQSSQPETAPDPQTGPAQRRRSLVRTGGMLAGVCGGLGAVTGIHAGWWRLLFIGLALFLGIGVLPLVIAYVVAIAVIPAGEAPPVPWNARCGLPRRPGGPLLGVCALLGERTPLPALLWRLGLLLTLPIGSWIPYLAIGAVLPGPPAERPRAQRALATPARQQRGPGARFWAACTSACLLVLGAGLLSPVAHADGHLLIAAGVDDHALPSYLIIIVIGSLLAWLGASRQAPRPVSGATGGWLAASVLACLGLVASHGAAQPVLGGVPLILLPAAVWVLATLAAGWQRKLAGLTISGCGLAALLAVGLASPAPEATVAGFDGFWASLLHLPAAIPSFVAAIAGDAPEPGLRPEALFLLGGGLWLMLVVGASTIARLANRAEAVDTRRGPALLAAAGIVACLALWSLASLGGGPPASYASGWPGFGSAVAVFMALMLLPASWSRGGPDPASSDEAVAANSSPDRSVDHQDDGHRSRPRRAVPLLIGLGLLLIVAMGIVLAVRHRAGPTPQPPVAMPHAIPVATSGPTRRDLHIRGPDGQFFTAPVGITRIVLDNGGALQFTYQRRDGEDRLISFTAPDGSSNRVRPGATDVASDSGWVVSLPGSAPPADK